MSGRGPSHKVWDPVVRLLHWALVLSVLSALGLALAHGPKNLHEFAGYSALTIVVLRLVWGFLGKGHARFGSFIRSPQKVMEYVASLRAGKAAAYAGHNPLGGWMTVTLLCCVAFTAGTGWLYNTDRFWGMGWLATLHEALAWVLLTLAIVHLSGVIFMSVRYGDSLVRAMVTGYKKIRS